MRSYSNACLDYSSMNFSPSTQLRTQRLTLRGWQEGDLAPFAALNADPEVRRFFPSTLSREESDASVAEFQKDFAAHGFGFWAVDLNESELALPRTNGRFIGFIGIKATPFESHFTPAVEIGWRLARDVWGKGYAPEGARAVLKFAFDDLPEPLEEIVSLTATINLPSRRVMEKIGMTHDEADDFDHPSVDGGRLQRHVLYRISRERFMQTLAKSKKKLR